FLDFLFFVLAFTAQWHIAAALLRAVRRNYSPLVVRLMKSAMPAVFALLVVGYLLGFTEVRGSLPFTSPAFGLLSGLTELWLLTSSCGYALYLIVQRATRDIPFEPSRRRLLDAASGVLLASPVLVVGYGSLIERTRFRVREVDIGIPGLHPDL